MFKFHPLHKLILVFLLLNSIATFSLAENRHKYPKTKINEVKESLHGTELSDPYRWLEEQNSSETRTWIKQQQEFANSYLSTLPGRAELKEKIAAFLKLDSTAIPQRKAGNYFFFKRLSQQDQPVLYMRKGLSGKDDVLLDPNTAFQDKTSSYSLLDISEDAELIAYGTRRGGKDEVSVNLLDTTTKKPLTDELPTGRYQGISITPDKKGIYYSRHDKEGPRVFFHAIGKSASEDKVIFGNGYGVEKIIFNSLSDDGRYLLISVLYGSSS
ncbi:MAG: hypothetical protein JNN15_20600, partial [Blastocatellia bacterium]|nr:hypothetical protein [Blastocatellia bacterium]